MACVYCGRKLLRAAVSIPSQGGALAMGPKCARRAGLLKASPRAPLRTRSRAPETDPQQMALDLEAA